MNIPTASISEILGAIAALCQVNNGASGPMMSDVDKYQLSCQRYYLDCAWTPAEHVGQVPTKLVYCVMERDKKLNGTPDKKVTK